MKSWIINELMELLPNADVHEETIDDYLLELRGHSLKMVAFLARFSRQFGTGPKIMEFIQSPALQTLSASINSNDKVYDNSVEDN